MIFCAVPVFRIHERNLDMAKRRGPDHPSAQNIHLDLQSLCAQFPGEEDCKTSDIMSLKDPPVNILMPFFVLRELNTCTAGSCFQCWDFKYRHGVLHSEK